MAKRSQNMPSLGASDPKKPKKYNFAAFGIERKPTATFKKKARHTVADELVEKKNQQPQNNQPANFKVPTRDSRSVPVASSITKSAATTLTVGYNEDDEDEQMFDADEDASKPTEESVVISSSDASALPADFFDVPKQVIEEATSETKQESDKTDQNALPKGFFDDPVLDAKARNVPYKNPADEEWEKFQQVIAEEATTSQAIIEEDIGEILIDRTLEVIDDQITKWSKLNDFQKKVEQLHEKTTTQEMAEPTTAEGDENEWSAEEVDDEEINVFADWRRKSTLR